MFRDAKLVFIKTQVVKERKRLVFNFDDFVGQKSSKKGLVTNISNINATKIFFTLTMAAHL